jgi:integrase
MRYSGLIDFPTFPPRRALTHMIVPLTWASEVSLGRSQLHLLSPQLSQYGRPRPTHLGSVKKACRTSLKAARIPYFPIYNLRATFASRLSAAGEPDLFVAQMMGHSSASILPTYAKVIDEYRREAIKKLAGFRQSQGRSEVSLIAPPPGNIN